MMKKMIWIALFLIAIVTSFLFGVTTGSRKSNLYYLVRGMMEGWVGEEVRRVDSNLPDIFLIGDSLIARGNWRPLEKEWDVLNYGKGGQVIRELISGENDIPLDKAQAIILWCGVNDLQRRAPFYSLLSEYQLLLKKLRGKNAQILVLSIPYVRGVKHSSQRLAARECNSKVKSLCMDFGLSYLDVNEFLSDEAGLYSSYSRDGLHLNLAGYRLLIDEIKRRDLLSR